MYENFEINVKSFTKNFKGSIPGVIASIGYAVTVEDTFIMKANIALSIKGRLAANIKHI